LDPDPDPYHEIKELSSCHRLEFSTPNIFQTIYLTEMTELEN